MPVQFRLLGPVEVDIGGRRVELGHARQRCVLAALAVDAGRVVPVEVMLDRVWSRQLPRKARVTLSGYVSRLRALLAPAPDVALSREPDGYRLAVDPEVVDLHRFRALVARARAAGEHGGPLFAEALGLWRGPAFATLDTPWLTDVREELAAQRLAAQLDRNDLALERGHHAALLGEMSAAAAEHPWDERLAGQLMLALYRAGRQAEALRHYDGLRTRLADELGADPSPPLQQLHHRILTSDSALAGPTTTAVAPPPRQLPAPPGAFTGRARELTRLAAVTGTTPDAVVIAAVSGTAGVGKTALALHWAHRVASAFPDGQLYVNLRGFDPGGSIVQPHEAVRALLDALGVPPPRIPDGLDPQTALYRSLLTGRRMLVVLDNARDVEQVQPLLPGSSGCLVLVTSRDQLTGLVAGHGAHLLVLDLLNAQEARELLARRISAERVAAEPDAVDEIVTRCAGLPLALSVVAARTALHPAFPLHTLAAELRDSHTRGRLDALAGTDPLSDVRTVFSWSYQTLDDAAAALFRALSLHPGPDIATPAAASLVGVPVERVRSLLGQLTRSHLLTEHVHGRYSFHDLLRTYAAEQAAAYDREGDRRTATQRCLDHLLHTAHAATRVIDPFQGDVVGLARPLAGVVVGQFADQDEALAWFTAEQQTILAAIDHAADHGFESHAGSLAWTIGEYSLRRGRWLELTAAFETALDAAERVGDRRARAQAHHGLGVTFHMLGPQEQARTHLEHALKLYDELCDHSTKAAVHCNLALVLEDMGRPQDALDHAFHALDLQRATGDQVGQARALNSIGWYQVVLGNHRTAVTHLRKALDLLAECGDRLGQAAVLNSLGYAHHHLGEHRKAIVSYEQALHLNRQLRNRYREAETLTHLGDTHLALGNDTAAHTAWQQAMAAYTELNHPKAADLRTRLTHTP